MQNLSCCGWVNDDPFCQPGKRGWRYAKDRNGPTLEEDDEDTRPQEIGGGTPVKLPLAKQGHGVPCPWHAKPAVVDRWHFPLFRAPCFCGLRPNGW